MGVSRPSRPFNQRALGLAEFVHSGLLLPIVICWCQGRLRPIQLALRARDGCNGH